MLFQAIEFDIQIKFTLKINLCALPQQADQIQYLE